MQKENVGDAKKVTGINLKDGNKNKKKIEVEVEVEMKKQD